MAKKKVTRKAVSKQPTGQHKFGEHPLDLLAQLMVHLTQHGFVKWSLGPGTDLMSFVAVILKKSSTGKMQLLVGDTKPYTAKGELFSKFYKIILPHTKGSVEKEATELEQKAAKLRAQAKGQGGRP